MAYFVYFSLIGLATSVMIIKRDKFFESILLANIPTYYIRQHYLAPSEACESSTTLAMYKPK